MEEFKRKYYRRNQFSYVSNRKKPLEYSISDHLNPPEYVPNPKHTVPIQLRDKIYLEKVLENATKKREKRLDILKNRIKKDIEKNQYDKHYQVKNMTEYNILKEYITTNLNPKFEFWWCNVLSKHFITKNGKFGDKHNLYVNKLHYIIGSQKYDYDSDYERIEFINKKVPVIYGYFHRLIK